jgi:glucose-6-phosphate 1-dehydrogenase
MKQSLFIVFGVSGDLAKRKLIPALYQLYAQSHLSKSLFLGVSHQEISITDILSRVVPFIEEFDQTIWNQFVTLWHFQTSSITSLDDMRSLAQTAATIEHTNNLSGSRLAYAAVPSNLFEPLVINGAKTKLIEKKEPTDSVRHIIIFEKPFGHDYKSAHHINQTIKNYYHESQIYRIDHYLTKEIVSNIALIRFTNLFFQPLWNSTYIEQVQIVLHESLTISDRGLYYDQFGALKDVVQNHMLQLLALVAMESPVKLTHHDIAQERTKILQKIRLTDGFLGQYNGYRQEAHVASDSTTETFAILTFAIDHPTWQNVPFIISTGKALNEKNVGIYIKFKAVDCLLTKGCPTDSNWLTIKLSPERRFYLTLNVKKAGVADEVVQNVMEIASVVNGNTIFGTVSYEPYENLLRGLINNQEVLSISWQEIEIAWNIIDAIHKKNLPLYFYEQNSHGPDELKAFYNRWNIAHIPQTE